MRDVLSFGRMVGRIQRLCLFGPGGLTVMPSIMRELNQFVPSGVGPVFLGRTNNYETNSVFGEDSNSLSAFLAYAQDVEMQDLETNISHTIAERTNQRPSTVDKWSEKWLKIGRREFLKTGYYDIVCHPMRWQESLIVNAAGPQGYLATMVVPRTTLDPEFSKRDIRLLETVAPFITHALSEQRHEGPFVDSDDRALVIADATCSVHHASHQAQRLLMMARFSSSKPTGPGQLTNELPPEVIRLCRSAASFSEAAPMAAPPVWRCKNEWGEFVFRVFLLQPQAVSGTPRLLGVSVERREPLRLKLLRKMGDLPLSTRETQLCLALLDGDTKSIIAERLGISQTTAITHTRNLYNKLDVHNRTELAEKLHAY